MFCPIEFNFNYVLVLILIYMYKFTIILHRLFIYKLVFTSFQILPWRVNCYWNFQLLKDHFIQKLWKHEPTKKLQIRWSQQIYLSFHSSVYVNILKQNKAFELKVVWYGMVCFCHPCCFWLLWETQVFWSKNKRAIVLQLISLVILYSILFGHI